MTQKVGKYPPLKDCQIGTVVTRFPPEPSGFLHIGHSKAILLNSLYAKEYQGQLIIRVDDTNPTKEKQNYVDNIITDLKLMNIGWNKFSYTSDYFDQIQFYAEQLLRENLAYIDDASDEQIKKDREARTNSISRDRNSVERNIELWQEMKLGTELGQRCVYRAKIDMKSNNGTLRDPNLYRVNFQSHYRTGTKYKIYPTYDFACPIVDSLEGVTHAFRSNEYHDRNALYQWVLINCKLRPVSIEDFSRLTFTYTLLSKRKLQKLIDCGIVDGWDHPALPTIQGLCRRGLRMETLREFVLSQGASKANSVLDIDKLWALNRSRIDPIVPRYTAIANGDLRKLILTNFRTDTNVDQFIIKKCPRHRKNADLGTKDVYYTREIYLDLFNTDDISEGEEITLMNWGNVIIKSKNNDGLVGELHLDGNPKNTSKKLTWLPICDIVKLPKSTLLDFKPLLTKPHLTETEENNWENYVNKDIQVTVEAIADPELLKLKLGDQIQIERHGYFSIDYINPVDNKIILIKTPDGHKK